MDSNNKTTQDYSNLPVDQTGNNFTSLQILDNSNGPNIVGMSNTAVNTGPGKLIIKVTAAPGTLVKSIKFLI